MMDERLVILVGEDLFRLKQRTQEWLKLAKISESDTETYDLEETPVEEVINSAMTIPFLSERKGVVGLRALCLGDSKLAKEMESSMEYLYRYFSAPSESTLLILQVPLPALSIPKTAKDLLALYGVVEVFESSKKQDLYQEVKTLLHAHNKTIHPDALEELIIRTNESSVMLDHEVAKIVAYTQNQSVVTLTDIETITPKNVEDNIFELINQIVVRDRSHALKLLKDLLKKNVDSVSILSMLASKFLELVHAKALMKQQVSLEDMMKYFNYSKGRLYYVQKNAKEIPDEVLSQYIDQLSEYDFKIKSGQMDKQLALELFIFGL